MNRGIKVGAAALAAVVLVVGVLLYVFGNRDQVEDVAAAIDPAGGIAASEIAGDSSAEPQASASAGDAVLVAATEGQADQESAAVRVDMAWHAGEPKLEEPAGSAVIIGRVVDGNGRGVAGADVVVRASQMRFFLFQPDTDIERHHVRTDATGRFAVGFTDVVAGAVSIDVRADGFAPGGTLIEHANAWASPMGRREIVVALQRGTPVAGRVVDESGRGLAGQTVYLGRIANVSGTIRTLPDGADETVTDDSGRFRFDAVAAGRVTIGTKPDDMGPTHQMIEAPHSDDVVLTVPDIGVLIEGFVYLVDSGEPVADATVHITHENVRTYPPQMPETWRFETDGRGAFVAPGLQPGTHTLRTQKDGFTAVPARNQNARVVLEAGDPSPEVLLYLNRGVRLVGTVVNHETGRPLSGVDVTLRNLGREFQAKSNESGDFVIDGLAVDNMGTSRLSFMREGEPLAISGSSHSAASILGILPEEAESGRAVRQWQLSPLIEIAGTVLGPDRVPAVGQEIVGVDASGVRELRTDGSDRASSDAEGRFSIRAAAGATMVVHARDGDVTLASTSTFTVPRDGRDDLELILPHLAELRVRVVDEEDEPVADANVTGWVSNVSNAPNMFGSGGFRFGSTDSDGWTEWKRLPAERNISANATADGFSSSVAASATLEPNGRDEVTVVLERGREVLLVLTNADGEPVTDIRQVSLVRGGSYSSGRYDHEGEGRFRVRGVPRGGVTEVTVMGVNMYGNGMIQPNADELAIQMRSTTPGSSTSESDDITIAVTVLDPSGQLVPDLTARNPTSGANVFYSGQRQQNRIRVDNSLDGTFYIETDVRPTTSLIRASAEISAPGFASRVVDLILSDKPDESGFIFTTVTLERGAVMSGRIVAADDGSPVSGATVEWSHGAAGVMSTVDGGFIYTSRQGSASPTESSTTDDQGRFELSKLPASTTSLRITPPEEFMPRSHVVRPRQGESRNLGDIAVERKTERTVRLTGPASAISGREIILAAGAGNLQQAPRATTDSQGVARFTNAPDLVGNVNVVIKPNQTLSYRVPESMQRAPELRIPIGDASMEIELLNTDGLQDFINLSFRSTVGEYQVAINTGTNLRNALEITHLAPGTWEISAVSSYRPSNASFFTHELPEVSYRLEAGQSRKVELDFLMSRLNGRIVDEDGDHIPNARITMNAPGQTNPQPFVANSMGNGEFGFVASTLAERLIIQHHDYATSTTVELRDLRAGEDNDIGDIVLTDLSGGRITLTLEVKDTEGAGFFRRFDDDAVVLQGPGGASHTATVNSGLNYVFGGLAEGSYIVDIRDADQVVIEYEEVAIELGEDGREEVIVPLTVARSVTVNAVDPEGTAVGDVEWSAQYIGVQGSPVDENLVVRPQGDRYLIVNLRHPVAEVRATTPDGKTGAQLIDAREQVFLPTDMRRTVVVE